MFRLCRSMPTNSMSRAGSNCSPHIVPRSDDFFPCSGQVLIPPNYNKALRWTQVGDAVAMINVDAENVWTHRLIADFIDTKVIICFPNRTRSCSRGCMWAGHRLRLCQSPVLSSRVATTRPFASGTLTMFVLMMFTGSGPYSPGGNKFEMHSFV